MESQAGKGGPGEVRWKRESITKERKGKGRGRDGWKDRWMEGGQYVFTLTKKISDNFMFSPFFAAAVFSCVWFSCHVVQRAWGNCVWRVSRLRYPNCFKEGNLEVRKGG